MADLSTSLDDDDRRMLLRIARDAINRYLQSPGEIDPPDELTPGLKRYVGAFVTLHLNKDLRGCVGSLTCDKTVAETVAEVAVSAAFEDYRFDQLSRDDIERMNIEVSVLSEFTPIDDISQVVPGKHGLWVESEQGKGLLLPQVAEQHGWDRETFLRQTCVKAGLSPSDWQKSETTTMVFTAEVFSEKDYASKLD